MARPKITLFEWTVETVQKELGIQRSTFLKSAGEHEIRPDEHGRYTSKQVFRAITGNMARYLQEERLAVLQEQRRKLALVNAETEGRLVDSETVFRTYAEIFTLIQITINSSELSEQEKQSLASELQRVVTETPAWAPKETNETK